MKQAAIGLILITVFSMLTACKTDGGGSANNNHVATVPGPQGTIEAYSNPNVYCQFGGGAFTCYQKNSINGLEICRTETKTYSDIPSMCQQIGFMQQQSQMQQCNVGVALDRIYREHCQGIAQPIGVPVQPGFPRPSNPNQFGQNIPKTISCELTAYNGRHVLPKSQMTINLDSNQRQEFNFNKHYFCIDYRRFGMTKMIFTPGSKANRLSDTITLKNEGLDSEIVFSQTGFAGQEVRLEAQDHSGRVRFELSCTGQSHFKKYAPVAKYTQFICKGKSNLLSAHGERQLIDVVLPYDSSLLNSDIQLASGLTARITGDRDNADSARIEYSADGLGRDYSSHSAAYLKTVSTFKASNGHRKVDVSCSPR